MDRIIAAMVAIVCVIVLLKSFLGDGGSRGAAPKPVAKRFMTPREIAMLDILERMLPEYRFHAQVAMGALLKPPPRSGKRNPADRNAFAQKIVDFVVQNPLTGEVVALIEVDDASHDAVKDQARDAMTAHAGYRTIRIGRAVQPKLHEVRVAVAALLPALQGEAA